MHISEDSNLLTKEQLKMKGLRQANALLQQGTTLKQADMQPPGGARLGPGCLKKKSSQEKREQALRTLKKLESG